MAINMEYLAHFIVAAEYCNFKLAAERLFMNPSTLSRQIKDLEDECGVTLFIRNGRSVELTQAGKSLCEVGRPLLAHLDQVTELVSRSGARTDPRITLYSVPAFFDALTEVIRRVRLRDSRIEFCIHHLQQEDIGALLDTDAIEFLVTYGPFLDDDPRNACLPLTREGFCAVCSPTHPLAQRESVTLDECLRENILFGADFPLLLRRGRETIEPDEMSKGSAKLSLPSYYAPVCLNEGIVILPASSSFAPGLRYLPISDPEVRCDIVVAWRKSRALSDAGRLFVDELTQLQNA